MMICTQTKLVREYQIDILQEGDRLYNVLHQTKLEVFLSTAGCERQSWSETQNGETNILTRK